jgi:hypothetical protein
MLIHRLSRLSLTLAILCSMLAWSPNVSRAASLGVHDYSTPGVQVILLSVKRTSDGYLTLRWAYHNTTSSPQTIGKDSGAQSSTNGPWSLAWDVYVVSAGTKYELIKDQTGTPLAGTKPGNAGDPSYALGPHLTFTTWAKVPAPGKDVTTVTVYIRGAEPFEDVPIS